MSSLTLDCFGYFQTKSKDIKYSHWVDDLLKDLKCVIE